jgi:uncharacterized lipoprotein YmbA
MTSRFGIMLAIGLSMAGCATSTPTRYYQMVPVVDPNVVAKSPTRLLAVDQVGFPEYLDRPGIVTRTTDTGIAVADFDQWSEPLPGMFSDVLVENLRRTLGGEHVVVIPNDRGFSPSMELDVNVLRFDVDAAGRIVLDARWRLFDGDGRLLATERSELVEQATAGDYPSVVGGMSRAVGALAAQVVTTLPAAVKKAGRSNERDRES